MYEKIAFFVIFLTDNSIKLLILWNTRNF